ncbi:cation-translocating P-type ATPase [Pedobacter panaciterrae]
MNWHKINIQQLFKLLGTSKDGLKGSVAEDRMLQFGANDLAEAKKNSWPLMLVSQFADTMNLILLVAAVVSATIGDMANTLAILAIVFTNALMGFFQEFRTEKALKALKLMSKTQARVIREGKNLWLPATSLVPGDVVMLEAGNAVPADMRLIETIHLKIDESALTGESEALDKVSHLLEVDELAVSDKKNIAFKGTFVAYGRGTGVVIATGMQTELGRIAMLLRDDQPLTPLQIRMAHFGKILSLLILLLCILFFVAGWLRGEDLFQLLLVSISLAVAAIPEALPAVITIALALAAKRMVRFNALIRKLPAVETLGAVTYICTDKTGTLTLNKMRVEKVFAAGEMYSREMLADLRAQEFSKLLFQSFALNNDVAEAGNGVIKGDNTEIALMEVAKEYGVNILNWPRIAELAFDSERKLMTTFHKHNNQVISFTKGAPEILLPLCENVDLSTLEKKVNDLGTAGYRVLGFACRYWDKLPEHPQSKSHECHMRFLGLVGLMDPPREGVAQAIAECKSAGITPVMITGDHLLTAKSIARRIGILTDENDMVFTGHQLELTDEESFLSLVERIKVYARVSPEQKLQIVKMLQKKGHYVAMTGDGVNDAPSLKRANIGVSMGITGTDVAKEAADMILLDDNFSTIIKAVKEGRRIYDNILKFIKYLMTTNSSEIMVLLMGPVIGLPIALLPIHILWINLVSDGLPAISLSYEKAEKNIMERPPRPPQENVFGMGRGLHMVWVGVLMAGVVLITQAWAINNGLHWQTIVFNVLSLSQMGHLIAIRSERQSIFTLGFLSNRRLAAAVLLVLILQFAITYAPFLQRIFKTESLDRNELLLVTAASSVVFIFVEIEKVFLRKKY